MAYENLCMYCFKDANGANICPHCGKDARAAVPQVQMLPGTLVYRDRFLVGRALGQDANGIVYNALDTRKGGSIRIREYLPRNCAERLGDGGVVPVSGMEDAFETGMRKLRASVESVEDPRKRHFYFEENGTAYIAQRKNVKGMPMPDEDDMDDEEDRGRSVVLYVAIAAAVVLAVAIAIIWFLSSMSDPDDITTIQPLSTVSAEATWMPQETPTPTPYATATFAALVDPELSWMDYTYPGDVESEYEKQEQESQPTRMPTIIDEGNYGTVNSSSSEKKVEELQERLAELGWLDYSKISGKYNSATKQAVKDFQKYVNDYCSPAEKLAVDGIAGKKTQQWLYNASVSLTKPTPTPEPVVTAEPERDIVDKNSTAREIRAVQKQLIFLGLLPEGSADGEYGAATVSAVKNFQIRVNKLQGYAALEITGTVDALTQAYLDYYESEWEKHLEEEGKDDEVEIKPTSTPKPTEAPEGGAVNADSSRAEIRAVQEQLQAVGLLKKSDIDGSYGKKTISAVKEFQRWVNEARGVETLEVTGECDLLTQRYLEYCIENGLRVTEPEQTATPEPTEEPDEGGNIMVDESSPKDSVMFVQEMLATIGLLNEDDIDGSYGRKTISAVKEFQQFINDYYGEKKLQLTGVCDASTLQFLEYAYSNEWQLGEATPEPTDAPTPEPTDEPTPEPESDTVNADSSPKRVKEVQQLLAYVGLLDESDVDGGYGKKTRNAIKALQQFVNDNKGETVLEVTGECDPLTRKYLEYCVEQGWNLGEQEVEPTPEPTDAPTPEPTDEPTPEPESDTVNADSSAKQVKEVQQLLAYVGLLDESDVDGGYGKKTRNAVKTLQQFVNDNKGETVLEVTGECDPLTRKYLEYCVEQGWNLGEQEEPEATEPPVQDEPDPTQAPAASEVRGFAVAVDGVESDGSMVEISSGKHSFAWKAKSGVESFHIYLYDGNGQVVRSKTAEKGGEVSIKAGDLEPGEIYRLEIGALPENGAESDIIWKTIHISRVEEEVQATPEPTREPEKASVSKPTITLGSSAYQEDGVTHISGDTVIFSWMADGDVEYYNAELVYEDGTSYSLGDTTDTSKTVPTTQLEPGKWILHVGAMPVGGSRDDMKWSEFRFIVPEPDAPEQEPDVKDDPEADDKILDYVDETSDPEDIKKVQMALYEYGLIDTDRAVIGVLDAATMEAVKLFQEKVCELFDVDLVIVDPEMDSFIDMDTLDFLLYRELDLNV